MNDEDWCISDVYKGKCASIAERWARPDSSWGGLTAAFSPWQTSFAKRHRRVDGSNTVRVIIQSINIPVQSKTPAKRKEKAKWLRKFL